ncbi:hypothetical protein R6Q57_006299 [Mikania cordata]
MSQEMRLVTVNSCCWIGTRHQGQDNEEYKFKDKPYKVKHVFVEYLHNWKHPKAQLEDLEITRLQLKWATRVNIKDCGVFAMRHMECFMGGPESEFDCGFA